MNLNSGGDFEEVYERYAQPIYRFLYWQTKDRGLSQDLTSAVFERAWKARQSFKGGSVQAWLYRIARNALTDHWRKKKELLIGDWPGLADRLAAAPEAYDFDHEQTMQQLSGALDGLAEDLRAIVILRFIEGLSAKRVGEILDISEVNVRVKQFRALMQLKNLLEDHAKN